MCLISTLDLLKYLLGTMAAKPSLAFDLRIVSQSKFLNTSTLYRHPQVKPYLYQQYAHHLKSFSYFDQYKIHYEYFWFNWHVRHVKPTHMHLIMSLYLFSYILAILINYVIPILISHNMNKPNARQIKYASIHAFFCHCQLLAISSLI